MNRDDVERLVRMETMQHETNKKITALFDLMNDKVIPPINQHSEAISALKRAYYGCCAAFFSGLVAFVIKAVVK